MTYRLATCTENGTIIEIDDEVTTTFEQASNWLGAWVKVGDNLWKNDSGYACIVEYN